MPPNPLSTLPSTGILSTPSALMTPPRPFMPSMPVTAAIGAASDVSDWPRPVCDNPLILSVTAPNAFSMGGPITSAIFAMRSNSPVMSGSTACTILMTAPPTPPKAAIRSLPTLTLSPAISCCRIVILPCGVLASAWLTPPKLASRTCAAIAAFSDALPFLSVASCAAVIVTPYFFSAVALPVMTLPSRLAMVTPSCAVAAYPLLLAMRSANAGVRVLTWSAVSANVPSWACAALRTPPDTTPV